MTKLNKEDVALVVAIIALAAYVVIIVLLLISVVFSADAARWDHTVYLLTGVEAIVFAATGFLFGREVNRVRAEGAEQQVKALLTTNATMEKLKCDLQAAAQQWETKGYALKEAIMAKLPQSTAEALPIGADEAHAAQPWQQNLTELVMVAENLFPQKG